MKKWLQQWIILFGNIHKIIEHLDKGSFQNYEKSEKSLVSKD